MLMCVCTQCMCVPKCIRAYCGCMWVYVYIVYVCAYVCTYRYVFVLVSVHLCMYLCVTERQKNRDRGHKDTQQQRKKETEQPSEFSRLPEFT